jgi:Carboxypeptidase regulatory-like domain
MRAWWEGDKSDRDLFAKVAKLMRPLAVALLALVLAACDGGDLNSGVPHGPGDPDGSPSGGLVLGLVTADGEPISGAPIEFRATDGRPMSGEGFATLDDGSFERRLDPGEYEITIVMPGYEPYVDVIAIDEGGTVELDVKLTSIP